MTDWSTLRVRLVLLGAVLAGILVPTALLWSRLPATVATHWGISGEPDGFWPRWVWPLVILTAWVGLWAVCNTGGRDPMSAVFGGAGVVLWANTFVVVQNLDREHGRDAGGITVISLLAMGVLCVGGAVAGQRFDRRRADPPVPFDLHALPSAGLRRAEGAAWTSSASNVVGTALTGGLVVFAVMVGAGRGRGDLPWLVGLVLVAVVVSELLFIRVRVRVDSTGVTAALGMLKWPRVRRPLDWIVAAQVEDVRPMKYGGWGWRRGNGASALVIRGGEAVRLRGREGRDLLITVDDAQRGAGTVNDLVRLQRDRT